MQDLTIVSISVFPQFGIKITENIWGKIKKGHNSDKKNENAKTGKIFFLDSH